MERSLPLSRASPSHVHLSVMIRTDHALLVGPEALTP